MAEPMTSKLTRPQRKSLFIATMVMAWLTVALWLAGSTMHSMTQMPSSGTTVIETTHKYGAPVFLIVSTVEVKDGSGTITSETTWTWKPLRVGFIASTLVIAAVVCVFGYRALMKRWRVAPHLCDECGYDLTGVASAMCPECGAQRTDGAKSLAPSAPES